MSVAVSTIGYLEDNCLDIDEDNECLCLGICGGLSAEAEVITPGKDFYVSKKTTPAKEPVVSDEEYYADRAMQLVIAKQAASVRPETIPVSPKSFFARNKSLLNKIMLGVGAVALVGLGVSLYKMQGPKTAVAGLGRCGCRRR